MQEPNIQESELCGILVGVAAADLDDGFVERGFVARVFGWRVSEAVALRRQIEKAAVTISPSVNGDLAFEYIVDALPNDYANAGYYTPAALENWEEIVKNAGNGQAGSACTVVYKGVRVKFLCKQIADGWRRPPTVKTPQEHYANIEWLRGQVAKIFDTWGQLTNDDKGNAIIIKKALLQYNQLGVFLNKLYPKKLLGEIGEEFSAVSDFFNPTYLAIPSNQIPEPLQSQRIRKAVAAMLQELTERNESGRLDVAQQQRACEGGLIFHEALFGNPNMQELPPAATIAKEQFVVVAMLDNLETIAYERQTYQDVIDRIARDAATLDTPKERIIGKGLAVKLQTLLDDAYSRSSNADSLEDSFSNAINKAERNLSTDPPVTRWLSILRRSLKLFLPKEVKKKDGKEEKRPVKEEKRPVRESKSAEAEFTDAFLRKARIVIEDVYKPYVKVIAQIRKNAAPPETPEQIRGQQLVAELEQFLKLHKAKDDPRGTLLIEQFREAICQANKHLDRKWLEIFEDVIRSSKEGKEEKAEDVFALQKVYQLSDEVITRIKIDVTPIPKTPKEISGQKLANELQRLLDHNDDPRGTRLAAQFEAAIHKASEGLYGEWLQIFENLITSPKQEEKSFVSARTPKAKSQSGMVELLQAIADLPFPLPSLNDPRIKDLSDKLHAEDVKIANKLRRGGKVSVLLLADYVLDAMPRSFVYSQDLLDKLQGFSDLLHVAGKKNQPNSRVASKNGAQEKVCIELYQAIDTMLLYQQMLAIFPQPAHITAAEHRLNIKRLAQLVKQAEDCRSHADKRERLQLLIFTYHQIGRLLPKLGEAPSVDVEIERVSRLINCFKPNVRSRLARTKSSALNAVADITQAAKNAKLNPSNRNIIAADPSNWEIISAGLDSCENWFSQPGVPLTGLAKPLATKISFDEERIAFIEQFVATWDESRSENLAEFQAIIDTIELDAINLATSIERVDNKTLIFALQNLLNNYAIGKVSEPAFIAQCREEIAKAETALMTSRGIFTRWSDIFLDRITRHFLQVQTNLAPAKAAPVVSPALAIVPSDDDLKRTGRSSAVSLSSAPPPLPSTFESEATSTESKGALLIQEGLSLGGERPRASFPSTVPSITTASSTATIAMPPLVPVSVGAQPSARSIEDKLTSLYSSISKLFSGWWFFIFTLLLVFLVVKAALGASLLIGWWVYASLAIAAGLSSLFLAKLAKEEWQFYSLEEKFTFGVKCLGTLGLVVFLLAMAASADAVIFSSTAMLPCITIAAIFVAFFFGKQAQKDRVEMLWQWLARKRPDKDVGMIEDLFQTFQNKARVLDSKDPNDQYFPIEGKETLLQVLKFAIQALEEAPDRAKRKQGQLNWSEADTAADIVVLERLSHNIDASRNGGRLAHPEDITAVLAILGRFKKCQISQASDVSQAWIMFFAFFLTSAAIFAGIALFNTDKILSVVSTSSVITAIGWGALGLGAVALFAIKILMERNRRIPHSYSEFVEKSAVEKPLQRKIIWLMHAMLLALNIWAMISLDSYLPVLLVTAGWGGGWLFLEVRSRLKKSSVKQSDFVVVDEGINPGVAEDKGAVLGVEEEKEVKVGAAISLPPLSTPVSVTPPSSRRASMSGDVTQASVVGARPARHVRFQPLHHATPLGSNRLTGARDGSETAKKLNFDEEDASASEKAEVKLASISRYFNTEDRFTISSVAGVCMQLYFVSAAVFGGVANYNTLNNPWYNFGWNFLNSVGNAPKNFDNINRRRRKVDPRDESAPTIRVDYRSRCADHICHSPFIQSFSGYDGDKLEIFLSGFEMAVTTFLFATNIISLTAQLKEDEGPLSELSSYGFALSMLACALRALKTSIAARSESEPAGLLRSKLQKLKHFEYDDQLIAEIQAIIRAERISITKEEGMTIEEIIGTCLPNGVAKAVVLEGLAEDATEEEKLFVATLLETNRKKFANAFVDFLGYLSATVCFWYLAIGRHMGASLITHGGLANIFLIAGGVIKLGQIFSPLGKYFNSTKSLRAAFLLDITPAVREFLERHDETVAFKEFFSEQGIKSANFVEETNYIIAYYCCREQILSEEGSDEKSLIPALDEKVRIKKFLKEMHADSKKANFLKVAVEEFAIVARCNAKGPANCVLAALEKLNSAGPKQASLFKVAKQMDPALRKKAANLLFKGGFFKRKAELITASTTQPTITIGPTIATPPIDVATSVRPTIAAPPAAPIATAVPPTEAPVAAVAPATSPAAAV
jgi:hypothetical protein